MNKAEDILKRLALFQQSEQYKHLIENDKKFKQAINFLNNDIEFLEKSTWNKFNKRPFTDRDEELFEKDRTLQLKTILSYLEKYGY